MRAPKAYTEALSQAYDERHFGGKSGQHILERDCSALWSLLDGTYSYVLDVPCLKGIHFTRGVYFRHVLKFCFGILMNTF